MIFRKSNSENVNPESLLLITCRFHGTEELWYPQQSYCALSFQLLIPSFETSTRCRKHGHRDWEATGL